MFKKSLLLMLLMAFMAPWAANAQESLPYSYGFENNDFTGEGWTCLNERPSGYSGITNSYAYNSTYSYKLYYKGNSNNQQILISPKFNGDNNTKVTVSFYYYSKPWGSTHCTFKVGYSTNVTVSGDSDFAWIDDWITPSSSQTWLSYNKTFEITTGSITYIAIKNDNNDGDFLCFDDFSFVDENAAPVPSINIPATAKVQENETIELTATTSNAGDNPTITWSTTDATVASISSTTGTSITVTGESLGSADITASITVGEDVYTSTCKVKVVNEILMHNGEVTTCNATFYDTGGENGSYSANEDLTLTIYPVAGMLEVSFESLTGEVVNGIAYDYLEIFDGENTSSSLIGKYTSNPGTITASNSTGALTFHFKSDESTQKAGWVATVSCNNCPVPTNLETSNLTHNTADISWTSPSDEFTVQYRTSGYTVDVIDEDFSGGIPETWTTIDNDGDGRNWRNNNGVIISDSWISGVGNLSPDNWLITPQVQLTGTLTFNYKSANGSYPDVFGVFYSTTGNAVSDFIHQIGTDITVSNSNYLEYSYDLSNLNLGTTNGYIAIRHYNCSGQYNVQIDDFKISYNVAAGTTITASNDVTTTSYQLTGLTPVTKYDVWVSANCGSEDSEILSFMTYSLFTKEISGYTSNDNGWYLIASPVVEDITPSDENGFLTDDNTDPANYTYDLYYFDQTGGTNGMEWKNYRQNSFNLVSGKGYLYANDEDTNLTFTGTPYNGDGKVALDSLKVNSDNKMWGWNLVGNPFGTAASVNKDYYRLGQGSRDFIAGTAGTNVEAMEGIFVKAEELYDTVTFAPAPQNAAPNSNPLVMMNLTQNRGSVIDRAIVRFNESNQLPKFMLNPENTKIYIPQNGEDYAIAAAEAQGEMPVNFRANENGEYTLTVSPENVEMNYLHLIDNMTGMDIDLLNTPSYTFNATTRDYESRFRLVFAATGIEENEGENESFAFFSNGQLIINNNGQATLQVIDITGHILSSETINGSVSKSINQPAGVYMLRLVNGNDVKVQKMVVR